MASKVQEAQEHIRNAEKHLKTTLLKWKPDLDAAADEFSLAAQCYRIARQLKQSMVCHQKAADLYAKNKSFFHAGKALENAILVDKEKTTPEEVYALALESTRLYQEHGSGDSGANVLAKAAKIIEDESPERAYKLYQMASDVSCSESSTHQGMEYTAKATRLLVRMLMYEEATDSVRREINMNLAAGNFGAVGRLTVAAVLIQLARGDIVAAEKCFREWGSNCEVAECETLERLLTAYDEEDTETAKRMLASPFIKSMDVEYARLAARLDLPQGDPFFSVGVRKNAAAPYVSIAERAAIDAAEAAAGSSIQQHVAEIEKPPQSKEAAAKAGEEEEEEEGGFC